jgi:hypothetical protein
MRVLYTVPLIGQPTRGTCWAASIAMMLAWRGTPLDVFNVRTRSPLSSDPRFTAAQVETGREGIGLSAHDTTAVLRWWGLVFPPGQTWTAEEFGRLLQRRGPLLAITFTQGSGQSHCRVVTGLEGNGTPGGTNVHINDPWTDGAFSGFNQPRGDSDRPTPGSRYRETYSEFANLQRSLVTFENRRLEDQAEALRGVCSRDRWTETVRQNQIHAPEADCNYVAHWP